MKYKKTNLDNQIFLTNELGEIIDDEDIINKFAQVDQLCKLLKDKQQEKEIIELQEEEIKKKIGELLNNNAYVNNDFRIHQNKDTIINTLKPTIKAQLFIDHPEYFEKNSKEFKISHSFTKIKNKPETGE